MQETIRPNYTEFLNEKAYNRNTGTKTLTQRAKAARKADNILSQLKPGAKMEYHPNAIEEDCGQFFVCSSDGVTRFYINFYGEVNDTIKGVEAVAEIFPMDTKSKRVTVKQGILSDAIINPMSGEPFRRW